MKRRAMKWLVANVLVLVTTLGIVSAAAATIPPEQPPDTAPSGATNGTTDTTTTLPLVEPEAGVPVAPPSAAPSAPLVQIPKGCASPPLASVVFVGRVVAKDYRVARYQIEQVRAGTTAGYALGDLIDVRYDSEVQYVDVGSRYLVGAAVEGVSRVLTSKVRPAKPLFGGNAVIGLTEKGTSCPAIEDPVRTLHVDGTEIGAGMLQGLSHDKRGIALAIAFPLLAVFAVVLALALVRWLFTGFFVAVRRAAEGDPIRRTTRLR